MTFTQTFSNQVCSNALSAEILQTWKQNTGIRFVVSGILGNAVFFWLDKLLLPLIVQLTDGNKFKSKTLPTFRTMEFTSALNWVHRNAESVSFFVAYLLDIIFQHFSNALLVFGLDTIKTRELYLSSLATSYTAYFSTLCGSTILQAFLLQRGINKNVAFWGTIALGSLINFVVLLTLDARSKSFRANF